MKIKCRTKSKSGSIRASFPFFGGTTTSRGGDLLLVGMDRRWTPSGRAAIQCRASFGGGWQLELWQEIRNSVEALTHRLLKPKYFTKDHPRIPNPKPFSKSPTLYQLVGRSLNNSRNSWAEVKGSALPRRDLGAGQGEDPLISSQMKFKFGLQRDSRA